MVHPSELEDVVRSNEERAIEIDKSIINHFVKIVTEKVIAHISQRLDSISKLPKTSSPVFVSKIHLGRLSRYMPYELCDRVRRYDESCKFIRYASTIVDDNRDVLIHRIKEEMTSHNWNVHTKISKVVRLSRDYVGDEFPLEFPLSPLPSFRIKLWIWSTSLDLEKPSFLSRLMAINLDRNQQQII